MLDAEYEECVRATRSNDDTTGDDGDDSADTFDSEASFATMRYAAVGSAAAMPVEKGAEQEEEFSEAWLEYKRACAEEEEEARAKGITDEDVRRQSEVTAEQRQQQQRQHIEPLSAEKVERIKNIMAGVKLKPPFWAANMSEEEWMSKILLRAGFRPRPSAAAVAPAITDASNHAHATTAAAEKKKKKNKQAKKKKKKQADAAAAGATAVTTTVSDFEAVFPPLADESASAVSHADATVTTAKTT